MYFTYKIVEDLIRKVNNQVSVELFEDYVLGIENSKDNDLLEKIANENGFDVEFC